MEEHGNCCITCAIIRDHSKIMWNFFMYVCLLTSLRYPNLKYIVHPSCRFLGGVTMLHFVEAQPFWVSTKWFWDRFPSLQNDPGHFISYNYGGACQPS